MPYSATVVSIYRIPQLRGLSLYSYDATRTDVEASLWSVVEVVRCHAGRARDHVSASVQPGLWGPDLLSRAGGQDGNGSGGRKVVRWQTLGQGWMQVCGDRG